MKEILDTLRPCEKRAVAIIGIMIRLHGGKDGEGLFTGVGRYSVLQDRLQMAAIQARTVRQFWDAAHRMLKWRIGPSRFDNEILNLIQSCEDDADVLRVISDQCGSTIMIARRVMDTERKARSETQAPLDTEPVFNDDIPFGDPLDVFDKFTVEETVGGKIIEDKGEFSQGTFL